MNERTVWLDGNLVAKEDARASILCHGMQRGALFFDVGLLREVSDGRGLLFRPREHVRRFLQSAALLGLSPPWDEAGLLRATVETARGSGVRSALVRWSGYIPTIEPDVVPHPDARPSVSIAVLPTGDAAADRYAGARQRAARVSIPRDMRKAGPEVFPPQAKVAASYLGPMLAKRRALASGFDEVILLDQEGRIAEAPTANVFAVQDGVLVTPPLERILPGITRDSVLALARAEGIPAREEHLSPEALAGADEAFLVATSFPVQAIASVDGQPLRGGAPGPLTTRLKEAMRACERGEDVRFRHWVLELG